MFYCQKQGKFRYFLGFYEAFDGGGLEHDGFDHFAFPDAMGSRLGFNLFLD